MTILKKKEKKKWLKKYKWSMCRNRKKKTKKREKCRKKKLERIKKSRNEYRTCLFLSKIENEHTELQKLKKIKKKIKLLLNY